MVEWKRNLLKSWRRRRAARHRRLAREFMYKVGEYWGAEEYNYAQEAQAMAIYHYARAWELDR